MAEAVTVYLGESSPEAVALQLMRHIAAVEGMNIQSDRDKLATRAWILSTYVDCLNAARLARTPEQQAAIRARSP